MIRRALILAAVVACTDCAFAPVSGRTQRPPTVREGHLPGEGGTRLFYRVTGEGPRTIVVLHGGPGGNMDAIAPNLAGLTSRYRVVYYDQRGGRSELPADTALLEALRFVDDLEAVRRFFGLKRLNLLAHSFGAVLAAKYVEAYPSRVDRLLLLKPVALRVADAAVVASSLYSRADSGTAQRLMELVKGLQNGTSPDAVAACREYERLERKVWQAGETSAWRGTVCDAPPEAVKYAFQNTSRITAASFGWDVSAAIARLSGPLLVMAGDRYPTQVPLMHAWAAAVPNGRTLIVPDTGHGVPADRPDVFYPAVDAFMDGGWPKDAVAPGERGDEPPRAR